MPRYTFLGFIPRWLDATGVWPWRLLCGTLRNRDVARVPTWTYLRRSRKAVSVAAHRHGLYLAIIIWAHGIFSRSQLGGVHFRE